VRGWRLFFAVLVLVSEGAGGYSQVSKDEDAMAMKRRDFLRLVGAGGASLAAGSAVGGLLSGCGRRGVAGVGRRKVMVLAIDGLDPRLLRQFVKRGRMKHFERLMGSGHMKDLGTSLPPQSPVAWSDFISGGDAGVHGIFDFIHRDPGTLLPYFSSSRVSGGGRALGLGGWRIPLSGGGVELLRRGPTFWQILEERGVECMVFKMPANFPPSAGDSRTVSGLGTPDLLGTYGTFSFYTDDPAVPEEMVAGGRICRIRFEGGRAVVAIEGPPNEYRPDREATEAEFEVFRDPSKQLARISLQGQEVLLERGQWSEWLTVRFDLVPHVRGVQGICRMYLKQVYPHFKLYVSPINIDPSEPALPISTPANYAQQIAERFGPFYTQTFPEDFSAGRAGVLDDEEYLAQTQLVFRERMGLLDDQLRQFREGFFFFYFSTLDQSTHMMWRAMDARHPMHEAKAAERVKGAIAGYYEAMDEALAMVLGRADDNTTVMVVSDHGFAPFYREFNVNTWLMKAGHLNLIDPAAQERVVVLQGVDWPVTRAYSFGLNSIYLNRAGRERDGVVTDDQADELAERICRGLEEIVDPATGNRVVARAYPARKVYHGPLAGQGPDVVIGYARGYRTSDASGMGGLPTQVVNDRMDKWSGDHCMDPSVVPGTLLSSKPVDKPDPRLMDMAPTILAEFGVPADGQMIGRPIFKTS